MIDCQALGCIRLAEHLDYNPTNGAPMVTCPTHHRTHAEGYTFRLDKEKAPFGAVSPAQSRGSRG